jgi:hypothetical protein
MRTIDGMDGIELLKKPKRLTKKQLAETTIDEKQLKCLAETCDIPEDIIIELITSGIVSPELNTDMDHYLVWAIGKVSRCADFGRQLLSRFPFVVRTELCKTAGLSKTERYVYRMYKNNPAGKDLSLTEVCTKVCKREGRTFHLNDDAYSKEVYAMVKRIRNLVYDDRQIAKYGLLPAK